MTTGSQPFRRLSLQCTQCNSGTGVDWIADLPGAEKVSKMRQVLTRHWPSAKVGLPVRSVTKLAAITALFSTCASPNFSPELALARGDGRYARILRSLTGVQLLILDDWASNRSMLAPVVTSTRSSRNAMGAARPFSPVRSPSTNGTPSSATRHMPTPSSTASFTMPIASISPARA